MASAWEVITNRRSNPRYRIRLQASVSLVENNTSDCQWPSVLAYTTEISRDAIALLMPSTHMGRHDLRMGEHRLRIILAIPPSANVTIAAKLIHCGQFRIGRVEQGYLIGVGIEQISAMDCLLYDGLLRNLT